jgi:tRNA(adenine34) deaminase
MISSSNPNEHAELIALRNASKNMKSMFLNNATIYITQEPCIMCIESIINYKIKNIVYGSSSTNKNRWHYLQYLVQKGELDIVLNIKEKKCKQVLKEFFLKKRCCK